MRLTMLVLLLGGNVVVADAVAAGHGEVAERGKDHNQGGDDVVQALGDGDVPGHAGEDDRRDKHDDKDNPSKRLARRHKLVSAFLVFQLLPGACYSGVAMRASQLILCRP